ncbi:MAG TPA: NAD-dependent epimerase/dehydratase family protein [Nocardioides sp.]|uniref:NAD-dependent epimerase/dehydratase family protein n=1 Tax=Nocardioides sp. TaxID=35761 RepID=UPI002E37D96A|nr:NAD-dependent epimerase/dehydratase family protein [Nocardioides sp.]HEX5089948.1 NAD-dependent epimerase/dehydratase family protein [Nocardioides sp.]
MRFLVTGGAGFIGRHVVAELRERGHHAVVADKRDLAGVDVLGDLREGTVREAAVDPRLDGIVHLAAETSVLGSVARPGLVHEVNVEVTAALVELARQRGVAAFVLASSNAVAGPHDGAMTEDVPLAPLTPYGATKAAAEMVLSGYAGAYGLRVPRLRLGNVYGQGMVDKDSLVPRLMRAAADGTPIEIYGDGLQVRDLVHVRDVARAFVLAAEDWPSGPVIIGSGSSITVLDILAAARECTQRPIEAVHVEAKAGEMRAVVLDTSLARSRGWEPELSLVEGIRDAWADFAPVPS